MTHRGSLICFTFNLVLNRANHFVVAMEPPLFPAMVVATRIGRDRVLVDNKFAGTCTPSLVLRDGRVGAKAWSRGMEMPLFLHVCAFPGLCWRPYPLTEPQPQSYDWRMQLDFDPIAGAGWLCNDNHFEVATELPLFPAMVAVLRPGRDRILVDDKFAGTCAS